METLIVADKTKKKPNVKTKNPTFLNKVMTREQFEKWEKPINEWNYEFNQGKIELKIRLKKNERFITKNLNRAFLTTNAHKRGDELFSEMDVWLTPTQMRRPDFAYFTSKQIAVSLTEEEPIPSFVIEVISPNDLVNQIEKKLKEYFEAGVQVVWHIYPELQMVKIYTSIKKVQICNQNDVCSASPAITDMEISVEELFSA